MRIFTFFSIAFISFIGYYAALAIIISIGLGDYTRYYSVPVRVFTALLMLYFILLDLKISNVIKLYKLFFWLFWIFYFSAIFRDWLYYQTLDNMEAYNFIGYSFIYSVIPFMFFSKVQPGNINQIYKKAILWSGFILALVTMYLYGDLLLSGVGRLSLAKYILGYEIAFISPLALSYSSSLIIGIGIYYLAFSSATPKERIALYLTIGMSFIPFLLGASRGSVLSLVLPLTHIFFLKGMLKGNLKLLLVFIFFGIVILYLATVFDSAVFRRTFNIMRDIQAGGESSLRLQIWEASIAQFQMSPIFGDSVQMREFSGYPHNLFLEVLMSTGIYGFIPFLCLVIYGISQSSKIIRLRPELTWVYILFAQGLIQHMFSGAVYSAIFFWGGIGLVFSVELNNGSNKPVLAENNKS
jgi:O-antigen ligase